MSRTTRPAVAWCPMLRLHVNGAVYGVEPFRAEDPDVVAAYRLTKADGTSYDVAMTRFGGDCSCPDFEFSRKGLANGPCKHVLALERVGLFPAPTPGSP